MARTKADQKYDKHTKSKVKSVIEVDTSAYKHSAIISQIEYKENGEEAKTEVIEKAEFNDIHAR